MIIRTLTLSAILLVGLSGCKTTPANGAVDRRAQLEVVQSALSDAVENGYAAYLSELRMQSETLKDLAALPSAASASDDLTIRNLVVSISSSALLADLPGQDEDIRTAVRNGLLAGERLDEACKSARSAQADCALGSVYRDTLESRIAASHALSLAVSDESVDAEAALLAYQTFESTLPQISEESVPEEIATTVKGLMRGQACTMSWAHSFLLSKVPPESAMSLNASFSETMAATLPLTGIALCQDGSDTCADAIECAADQDAALCKGIKAAAVLSNCGPASPELETAIAP